MFNLRWFSNSTSKRPRQRESQEQRGVCEEFRHFVRSGLLL